VTTGVNKKNDELPLIIRLQFGKTWVLDEYRRHTRDLAAHAL
jgi:hypothetical protein